MTFAGVVIGVLSCFILVCIMMLVRIQLVYTERGRWLDECPLPDPKDPKFYEKLEIVEKNLKMVKLVSFNEMVYGFGIPISGWRMLAEYRVEHETDYDYSKR